MIKKLTFAITLLLFTVMCHAQNTVSSSIGIGSILDPTNPVPTVNAKDLPVAQLEGSPYLLDNFSDGTFTYSGREFTYPVNIDILSYTMDIIYKGDTVFIDLAKMDNVDVNYKGYKVSVYSSLNSDEYGLERGVVYVQYTKAPIKLYEKVKYVLQKPDYDQRLGVGSHNFTIYKDTEQIIGVNEELFKKRSRIKADRSNYGSYYDQLRDSFNEGNRSYKELKDLVYVFTNL